MARGMAKVSEAILSVLGTDKLKKWNQLDLAKEAAKYSGYAFGRNELAVTILVGSGRITGRILRNGKASDIQWKELFVPDGKTIDPAEVASLKEQLQQAKEQLAEPKSGDRIVEVILKDAKGVQLSSMKGLFHSQFENLISLASARMNIFVYGPTGCGKSYTCGQLAESLGLPFYFISCTAGMSEGQLGGRLNPSVPDAALLIAQYKELIKQKIDPGAAATLASATTNGFSYVISEFVKAYENGGVFLLDEIDAADSNVLLLINAALANGHMAVPNRPNTPYAKRHKDFICVAAANTVGTGSDRLYSGRNRLDASTLDRFQIGKIFMDYDPTVEKILCPDTVLYNHLALYRKRVRDNNLERAVSTRFMQDAFKMKSQCGWSLSQIDESFFSGWKESEVKKVKGEW